MSSPPPAPPKARPPVTLKVKTHSASSKPATPSSLHAASITTGPVVATPFAMSPPPATPFGGTKIILKRSQPPTPATGPDGASYFAPAAPAVPTTPALAAPPSVTTTQKGRVSRPTAKKRARDFDGSDDEDNRTGGAAVAGPPKRPKLILKKSLKARTASIVLKQLHKEAPPRSKGEGYDSEDDDREPDPVIEEEFVLRMLPGEHCEYLRRMVDERKIGVSPKEGGADFHMRWLPGVERRALLTVMGTHFVGVLVDLPTITEGMKTWDKRNFMKSADICQMLLVFATVADEAEAKSIPLPAMVAKDFRWPHGLTPPMHDCVHRRFRKRLSKKEIKDKEAELQRLLNEDRLAMETKWELFDDGRDAAGANAGTVGGQDEYEEEGDMMEEGEEDAYGEVDEEYYGQQQQRQKQQHPGAGEADQEAASEIDDAELEAMFMEEDVDDEDASAAAVGAAGTETPAATPATQLAETPVAGKPETPAAESEASDADADGDEEEDEDDEDLDEDEVARAEQAKGVREDINELKKQLQTLDRNLTATSNALLRKRIEENRKRVLSELRLKQASIGELDEEE